MTIGIYQFTVPVIFEQRLYQVSRSVCHVNTTISLYSRLPVRTMNSHVRFLLGMVECQQSGTTGIASGMASEWLLGIASLRLWNASLRYTNLNLLIVSMTESVTHWIIHHAMPFLVFWFFDSASPVKVHAPIDPIPHLIPVNYSGHLLHGTHMAEGIASNDSLIKHQVTHRSIQLNSSQSTWTSLHGMGGGLPWTFGINTCCHWNSLQ
jgi:hypothetical protein